MSSGFGRSGSSSLELSDSFSATGGGGCTYLLPGLTVNLLSSPGLSAPGTMGAPAGGNGSGGSETGGGADVGGGAWIFVADPSMAETAGNAQSPFCVFTGVVAAAFTACPDDGGAVSSSALGATGCSAAAVAFPSSLATAPDELPMARPEEYCCRTALPSPLAGAKTR